MNELLTRAFTRLLVYDKRMSTIVAQFLMKDKTVGELAQIHKLSVKSIYRILKEGKDRLSDYIAEDEESKVLLEKELIDNKFPMVKNGSK